MKVLTGIKFSKCALPYLFFVFLLLGAGKAEAIDNPFSIVEVIGPVGKNPNTVAAMALCKKHHWPQMSVYQWNNHLVVFGKLKDVSLLKRELVIGYPGCTIKVFQKPFYDFDRKRCCGNNGLAKDWNNILLTANLVTDPRLQQEYMNYHATQFQKWPEVANGFCNADFQQVLVFRNGRQLILVISIPKGESLDKLNPKTAENNPKVDQWNRLMRKYQEGMPGTKPGEVWVYLKQAVNKYH
jgi:hypothetical protein